MKGRRHELNLQTGFDPLDPAQVSDPNCWIVGDAAEMLKWTTVEKIAMLRRAPLLPFRALDLSGEIAWSNASAKWEFVSHLPQPKKDEAV